MLTFSSMPDLFAYDVSDSISSYGFLESIHTRSYQCVHLVKFAVIPVQSSKPLSVPYIHLCFSTQISAMRYLASFFLSHFSQKDEEWKTYFNYRFYQLLSTFY